MTALRHGLPPAADFLPPDVLTRLCRITLRKQDCVRDETGQAALLLQARAVSALTNARREEPA